MRRAFSRLLLSVVLFAAGSLFGAAPTITSFTPTSGTTGTSVTLTGTNFTGATTVKFNGIAAGSFSVTSSTKIIAVAPTGVTTGKISVTTPGGTATSSSSFTKVAAPTLTSFTPTSGAAGATVTLTGSNFTGATAVKFNGTSASSYTVVSATSITAVAPAGVTTGTLSVTTPSGTATSSSTFAVVAAPTITSFTPTSVSVGTTVTLTGTNFTGATAFKFNGTSASSYTVVSATSITAVAPTGITTGKISVTTAGGTATSSASFTVVTAPTITTQPSNRTVTLGSTATFTVVATGTATLTYQWSKNGVPISGATLTSYTTPATVIADNGSTYTVKVTNSIGNITSSVATLTLNLPPAITSQPANQIVNVGSTASFTVVATGTGSLTFQWSRNGTTISAATSASYTIPAVTTGDNAKSFTVKVTNTYGNVTSAAAILTVTVPPPTKPVVTAPNPVTANQSGYLATVPTQAGCTYAWTIRGGAIAAGSTTSQITFTPSGPGAMAVARTAHAAVSLPDGRVLVTGGVDGSSTVLTSAEIYNPDQGGFSPTPTSMASARQNHTATLLMDGRVLIVGGFDQNYACLASAEIFDPTTGQFSVAPGALATARGAMTATLLPSGKVLLVGGWNSGIGGLSSAELFDPISGTFSGSITTMVSARFSHTATPLANGTVLIAGGSYNGPYPLATAEIFDPTTNAFHSTIGPMTSERQSHTASLLSDGRVLLAGGHDGISSLFSAECFDPVTGLFSGIASQMGSARSHHTAALLPSGQVLLAGGSGPEGSLAGGELFDPLSLVFTAASGNMSVAREGFTATPTSNGQILLVGGVNSSSADGTSTTLPSFDFYESSTALLGYMSTSLTCTVTNSLGSASQPGTLKVLVLRAISMPTITTKSSVITGRGGYTASVPTQYGCTYTWTITNGTITNGAGTSTVTFSAGAVGTTLKLTCVVANAAGSSKTANATLTVAPAVLTLTPLTALLSPGGQQAFTANQPVVWDLDSGSITYNSTSATYKATRNGTNLGVGTYTLTATSKADSSMFVSAYITVFVTGSPIIDSFSASPGSIHAGQSTTLSWSVSNGTGLNLDPYAGPLNGNSIAVTPTHETTYILSASNELGTVTSRLTVGVDLVPSIADFTVNPSTVNVGGTTQFFANYTNGTGQISPGAQPIQSGATAQDQPKGITVYTLAVTNPYGAMATRDAQVDVTGPGAFLPTLDLASPQPSAMSTRLSDGRVCLMGGSPPYETQVQLFNPETGGFQLGSPLQGGRARGTATHLADEKILLWGGAVPGSNVSFLNDFEVVDPRRGVSSAYAINSGGMGGVNYPNSIVYRCDHSATRLADGRVLIVGGRSLRDGLTYSSWAGDRVSLATTLLVDPNANPGPSFGLNVAGSMITSRADHVAIRLLDGRVLVAGGTHVEGQPGTMYYSETTLTSSELFDPATDTWTAAGDLHDGRNAQNPVLLTDGRVVFDGREVFDPATLTFTLLPAPYKGFSGFGTEALLLPDGRILMSSGHAHAGPLLYNPANNLCTGVTAPSPSGNYLGSGYQSLALLQDGTALLIGGGSPSMARADHLDPQAQLSITPSQGYTNVGVPLPLLATGVKSSGATWNTTGGAVIANGTFMSSAVGLFPVTATALDGTKATIMVEVFPAVKVVFGTFTYPGIGAILNAGVPVPFSAHVQNTPDQRLIWSVQEGPSGGTVTASGVYTAASAGTWHVIATSVADTTQSAAFTITTAPPIALSVQPQHLTVLPGQDVTFTITEPTGQTRVSLDAPGLSYPYFTGTISYKAPVTAGTYNLVATSTLDLTKSVVIVLTVVPITELFISPSSLVLRPSGTSTFLAYARSSSGLQDVTDRVIWNATSGFLSVGKDSHGLSRAFFNAPSAPGTCTVSVVLSGTGASAQSLVTILPADAFTTAGPMTVDRDGFTMTRLLDGRILVAGGEATATAEIYDPATKGFTALAAKMQRSRMNHTATLLANGKVLLVGGELNSALPIMAELFDPVSHTFSPAPGVPLFRRSYHFATCLPNGLVLLSSGTDGYSNKSLELYDPIAGTFTFAGFLNNRRTSGNSATTLLSDGRVVFAGPVELASGSLSDTQASTEIFDFKTSTSIPTGNMNQGCKSLSMAQAADGRVWALGDNYTNSTLEWFDPCSATFTNGMRLDVHAATNATELVDGSIWASGYEVYSNGYRNDFGMRFFFDRNIASEAIHFAGDMNSMFKTALLPSGEVLITGKPWSGNSKAAGLLVFDTTPNATILPHRITLVTGIRWPFQASSTGLGSAGGFTWSVLEGPAGGSVSPQGVYTAPTVPGTYHVVATSSDGSTSSRATVDVIENITLSLSPLLVDLTPGATQVFLANAIGTAGASISWSASGGAITQDGTFTAPTVLGTYTVTASTVVSGVTYTTTSTVVVTSFVGGSSGGVGIPSPVINSFAVDTPVVALGQPVNLSWNVSYPYKVTLLCPSYAGYPEEFTAMDVTGRTGLVLVPQRTERYQLQVINPSGTVTSQVITINVSTMPVTISITPTAATIYASQSMSFGFSLSAPTNRVVWSCSAGSITQNGAYTAPATLGTYTVTITSVDDPGKSASAAVTAINPFILTLSPTSLSLSVGGTKQFGFSFTGPTDAVISWTTTGGTVTSNGLYTAPLTPGNYSVTVACSALNLYASATVTVVPITLYIFPSKVALVAGQTQQFGWSVNGGGVAFSVIEAGGGNVTHAGLYTAPVTAGVYTVQITSQLDPSRTSQAIVTVNPITIAIDPPVVTLEVNQTMRFGASLNNGGWTWSTTGGEVDDQGFYRAPLAPGVFTVTIQSLLDATKTATAQITVVAASTLSLTPNEITINCGGAIPMTLVGIPDGASVTWTIKGSDGSDGGGTMSPGNVFTAGTVPGTYIITATESSTGNRAYAQVRIISHRILPEDALVGLGLDLQFTAEVFDGSPSVSWLVGEANGGTIDAYGLYTAPLQQGQYHIIAQTSSGDLTTVPVMVGPPNGFTITPEINVLTTGTYEIRLRLKASNGKTTESLTTGDYAVGIANPVITFSQGQLKTDLVVDGPYSIDRVVLNQLLDGELLEVGRKEALGATGPYAISEGDKPWISIGAIQGVSAEDSNGNGLIDTLKIQINVDVICDGFYSIGSGLVSSEGLEVGRYQADLLLKRGTNNILLAFDGRQIYAAGKEGPYGLSSLTVSGAVTQSVDQPGVVTGYTLNQFEH